MCAVSEEPTAMKLALIGFGNAGSKVADQMVRYQRETGRTLFRTVMAVNSARSDLAKLTEIPEDSQLLIGQTDERVKGHGVGCDPELGRAVAQADLQELLRKLDEVPVYEIDAFLVVAGLGGGTGSGGAPVLADNIRETYAEPVYGLAILPGAAEGGRASFNAARTLQTFTDSTDNLLAFDNDTWRGHRDSVSDGYARTNRELAKRVGTLLSAGNLDGSEISENVMDASDVRRTLATGGVSSIAYAETDLAESTQRGRGLLDRFRDSEDVDTAKKVSGLVRQAVQSRLTCPADVASAERSLVVVSGPPTEFSRKGLESARQWLEDETGSTEVLAGDDPRSDAPTLSATVVLSNVTEVPRIDALQEQAVDAQSNIESQQEVRNDDIQELITADGGELDSI